ncbi:MAG: nucleotide sugar dehydrogenase, partial [bacterium]|nr:nucleotide sugar dehydrogenase [bacterium]
KHIPNQKIKELAKNKAVGATTDFKKLKTVDAIIICVPTPLNEMREPDLQYVETTGTVIAQHLRKGQLVSLESTTYPGTTDEILLNMFEKETKLKVGKDFCLVYSPEREDPGNKDFTTQTIPKVLGGVTPVCRKAGQKLYEQIIDQVVVVSSTRAAELTKLLENIYRCVNIAMVNELKILADRMDIDIWEVINASATKPFGFSAFYPGPGLGGHCIPIDPFYLSWKARAYDFTTKFIELAGEINTSVPYYVIDKVAEALNTKGKSIKGSKIMVLGIAYKKDIDDDRESPSLKLIDILQERGAIIAYNDPFIPKLKKYRKYSFSMKSAQLTRAALKKTDLVLIATDHSSYDYEWIAEHANLVVDTRNAIPKKKKYAKKVFPA